MSDKKGNRSVGNGINLLNQPGPQKQQVVTTDGQKTVRIIDGVKYVAISAGGILFCPPQHQEFGRSGMGAGSTLGKPKKRTISQNSRDRSRGDFQ